LVCRVKDYCRRGERGVRRVTHPCFSGSGFRVWCVKVRVQVVGFRVYPSVERMILEAFSCAADGSFNPSPNASWVRVDWLTGSGRGTTKAEDAQGTPTQSHISPIILVHEDIIGHDWVEPE